MTTRLDNLLAAWQAQPEAQRLSPQRQAELKIVWDASDYVAQNCLRFPEEFIALETSGELDQPLHPGQMAAQLRAWLNDLENETQLGQRLRRFRRRQMLRIIWRDLTGKAGLDETLNDLSELADNCIQQSLEWLTQWAEHTLGTPRGANGQAQSLIVLGMGKLGARELNLSSDIDLIFCFPAHGQTDGPRPLSNEAFFTRLGRQLINVLSQPTEEGFVFRVDMRLRPFGDAGPLVSSFNALEIYYETQAREWERYAMIKARPITGSPAQHRQLLDILRPFVYRRYVDFGVIAAIRDMKQKIQAEMHKKGMDRNIKLGRGGIREIEFIGQAFQLVHGGRDPTLQIRPIQPVLTLLGEKRLLPPRAVQALLDAYRFLRRTENRIQAWRDQQTHLLPESDDDQARLARSMGCSNWKEFEQALEHHRTQVETHFAAVFQDPKDDAGEQTQDWAQFWLDFDDNEQALEFLQHHATQAAQEWWRLLNDFTHDGAYRSLSASSRKKLDRLMPLLLGELGTQQASPQQLALALELLRAILKRSAYLDLFLENPQALEQLLRLAAGSPWIIHQLARYPVLLDELLDPRRLYSPLRKEELRQELDILLNPIPLDDLEQQMERLRQFAAGNRLRVAAADITGAIPLTTVSDYLTEIAEVVLEKVLQLAWAHMLERHGLPENVQDTGFVIIGYGKLGGWELGYGSDLDLVFLRQNSPPNAMTQGPKRVPNEVFYLRLGQRIIHLLNTRTPSGILYEVDMRLRPNGNSGLLVASMNTFAQYQREQAWTWEHQALVRARAIAGSPHLQEAFAAIRKDVLCQPRDTEKLRRAVLEMREKMRQALDHSNDERFDLKQGKGGITDIEFMVQYLVLKWAHEYPDLAAWTDNIRLLETLARLGLLARDTASALAKAYRTYRDRYHHLALQERKGHVPAHWFQEERRHVQAAWNTILAQPPLNGDDYADNG